MDFRMDFNSFSFLERTKLAILLTATPCHQPLTKTWKLSSFIHMFSKRKGVRPLLAPPLLSRMGK